MYFQLVLYSCDPDLKEPPWDPVINAVSIDLENSGLVPSTSIPLALFLVSKLGLIIIPVSAFTLAGIKSLTVLKITLSKNLIKRT